MDIYVSYIMILYAITMILYAILEVYLYKVYLEIHEKIHKEEDVKLTVLVDNNTLIDQYFIGEPAVSYYIEDGNERILFDAGYSDVIIHNANKLHIDLGKISKIVFSHGHNDHTGGFLHLSDQYNLSHV
jgi:glyoxylase-like metal-dependent hydrolase (beta-lactamase superfamily II)